MNESLGKAQYVFTFLKLITFSYLFYVCGGKYGHKGSNSLIFF